MKKLLSSCQAGSHDEIRLACCFLCAEGVSYNQLATNYGVDRDVISDVCCKGRVIKKNREFYFHQMITALYWHRFRLDPGSLAHADCTAVIAECCCLKNGLPYDASVWAMVEAKWTAKKGH